MTRGADDDDSCDKHDSDDGSNDDNDDDLDDDDDTANDVFMTAEGCDDVTDFSDQGDIGKAPTKPVHFHPSDVRIPHLENVNIPGRVHNVDVLEDGLREKTIRSQAQRLW